MKKVLIVDDDEGILEATRVAVELAGFQVTTVSDPNKVLALVKKHKPNIILLDLLLSGKDGKEVLEELHANSSTRHIPVIMLSAHPSAKESAHEAGADDFIPKPYDIDELIARIKKNIG